MSIYPEETVTTCEIPAFIRFGANQLASEVNKNAHSNVDIRGNNSEIILLDNPKETPREFPPNFQGALLNFSCKYLKKKGVCFAYISWTTQFSKMKFLMQKLRI